MLLSTFRRRILSELFTTSVKPFAALALVLSALVSMSGCGSAPSLEAAQGRAISGEVRGGQQPVSGSLIQLYVVGTTGDASASTPLIATTVTTSDGSGNSSNSNANAGNGFNSFPAGSFTITGDYACPSASSPVYLTATGGNLAFLRG